MKHQLRIAIIILLCFGALVSAYNLYMQYSISTEEELLRHPEFVSLAGAFEREGRPPAFLLLHGFSNAPFDMLPVAGRLAELGYAYRAIKLPGHGMSARNLQGATSEQWLLAAHAAYDELRHRYGQVGIVGFSMGADLALQIASQHEVRMLVVINPFLRFAQGMPLSSGLGSVCWLLQNVVPYVKKRRIGMINDPNGLKRYFAYWHMPLRAIVEVARLGDQAAQSARSVACDTLWVQSRADSIADFTASHETFNSLPARKKSFLACDQSDHTVLYDYDAEDVLAHMCTFIQANRRDQ